MDAIKAISSDFSCFTERGRT